jgi:hypothetical protein
MGDQSHRNVPLIAAAPGTRSSTTEEFVAFLRNAGIFEGVLQETLNILHHNGVGNIQTLLALSREQLEKLENAEGKTLKLGAVTMLAREIEARKNSG